MVPKAFKEVKQQVDIVGKGRGDHGDSSWKGFAVFSRRTCHYRLCQVIYAHPSIKCRRQSASHQDISPQKTPLSCTAMSTLHRMTWWSGESTGLTHLPVEILQPGPWMDHLVAVAL